MGAGARGGAVRACAAGARCVRAVQPRGIAGKDLLTLLVSDVAELGVDDLPRQRPLAARGAGSRRPHHVLDADRVPVPHRVAVGRERRHPVAAEVEARRVLQLDVGPLPVAPPAVVHLLEQVRRSPHRPPRLRTGASDGGRTRRRRSGRRCASACRPDPPSRGPSSHRPVYPGFGFVALAARAHVDVHRNFECGRLRPHRLIVDCGWSWVARAAEDHHAAMSGLDAAAASPRPHRDARRGSAKRPTRRFRVGAAEPEHRVVVGPDAGGVETRSFPCDVKWEQRVRSGTRSPRRRRRRPCPFAGRDRRRSRIDLASPPSRSNSSADCPAAQ